MTRNLPEPRPEAHRIADDRDALDRAVADFRRFLLAHKRTGVTYIRVNSNQGGITSADVRLEEKL